MSSLHCRSVTKRFGGLLALHEVDLEVRTGEIVGLVGPNGSGKTTLINVISGALRITGGQVHYGQTDVTRTPPHRRAHLGIARTYQIPRPLPSMSALENVTLALTFGRDRLRHAPARRRAWQILDLVHLASAAEHATTQLNLHQRKFLEVARALALDPKVLLLDEVLAGLNPTEIRLSLDMIRSVRDTGVSILFIEHNVKAVRQLSDRVYVLDQGRNLAEGLPDEVVNDERVIAAYLGDQHAEG